jgi:hypothetical protein
MTSTTDSKSFDQMQAALKESQTFRVNDAPMACDGICICDPRPVEEPRKSDWRGVYALIAACVGVVGLLWALKASAAERVTPGPHDLWLILKPTAINEPEASAQRNVFKIGTDFKDHAACKSAKDAMRKVAGTLQCLPRN